MATDLNQSPIARFIEAYQNWGGGSVEREGRSYRLTCPLHGGRSLIVSERSDGSVLINCMGGEGCNSRKQEIIRALGLRWSDLFEGEQVAGQRPATIHPLPKRPKQRTEPEQATPATVENLAEKTGLPVEYLRSLGVINYRWNTRPVVQIRYTNPDKSPAARQRIRRAMNGGNRFAWMGSSEDGEPIPYTTDWDRIKGDVFLVEGESDVWTLAYHGYSALGVTGAEAAGQLQKEHLEKVERLFVVRERDEGGRKFVSRIEKRLEELDFKGRAFVVDPDPGTKDVNEIHKADPDEGILGWAEEALHANGLEELNPPPFQLMTISNVLNQPPLNWMVEEILPEKSLSMIYGPPEQFKTFVALDLAYSIATGKEWHGQEIPQPGTVVYIAAEGSYGLKKRVQAWMLYHEIKDHSRIPFHVLPETVNFSDPAVIRGLIRSLPAKVNLIVLDTLHAMLEGDENSAKDVKAFLDGIRAVKKATGAAVTLIHHMAKEGKQERGSTSLRGAMDTMIQVKRTSDQSMFTTVTCTKQKDFERFKEKILKAKVVNLEDDETSLVMTTAEKINQSQPLPKLTGSKKRIVDYMWSKRDQGGEYGGWLLPKEIYKDGRHNNAGVSKATWDKARNDLLNDGYIVKNDSGHYRANVRISV